jgi:hypothetical protein
LAEQSLYDRSTVIKFSVIKRCENQKFGNLAMHRCIIPIYYEAVKKTAAEKEQDLIDDRYYLK